MSTAPDLPPLSRVPDPFEGDEGALPPPPALPSTVESTTVISAFVALPAPGVNAIPAALKPRNAQCSICNRAPLSNSTPDAPASS